MRRIILCSLSILLSVCMFAQNTFGHYYDLGVTSLEEKSLLAAKEYFEQAYKYATNDQQKAMAERKLIEVQNLIAPPPPPQNSSRSKKTSESKSKDFLYMDVYLENGDVVDFEKEETVEGPSDFKMSVYTIKLYDSYLKIVSHVDYETKQTLSDFSAGTICKLGGETDDFWFFLAPAKRNGLEEYFIVSKEVKELSNGRFIKMYHLVGETCYCLYSKVEIAEYTSGENRTLEDPLSSSVVSNSKTSAPVPVEFRESWFLNYDSEQNLLGDSRSESLYAKDICWLVARVKYDAPGNYDQTLQFDIKVTDPDGKLLKFSNGDVKEGFSLVSDLEVESYGGYFNLCFGSDKPGSFKKGKYKIEIWREKCYYSTSVTLL